MEYSFSENARALKPSAIREILKMSAAPGIIPFSAGNPSPEAFPSREVAQITQKLFAKDPIAALQYSVTEGYTPLRETLKAYMQQNHDSFKGFDDILITAGAQQVMSLAAAALCGAGDTILCEEPSFVGSINALKLSGASLTGIPMQEDGLDLAALEEAAKTNKNVKLLYIIPNFQNPTGITTSLKKRRAIYALAKKYGFLILEDNPYGDLYFTEESLPSIKSMDTDGIVLYAGSFSKVLSPGLRVGFCIAPQPLIAKFTAIKQTQDVHSNILAQMIAYHFMTDYDFAAHLKRLRALYKEKAALCRKKAEECLMPEITCSRVTGGLFLWCALPPQIDMQDFCTRAIREYRVAVVPGSAFLTDPQKPCQNFRVNYSTPTDEQIISGMDALKLLKNAMLSGK